MNETEALVLLTRAAMLDARMKRTDPVDQADMAEAWSRALPDVTLVDALAATEAHYRSSRDAVMIADIVAAVGAPAVESPYEETHDGSQRAVLETFGTTPEEYEADPAVRKRVAREWRQRELEAGDE